jgi:hypothetical protein
LRLHTERTVVKALSMYIRTCSLYNSERLITSTKLTLYIALIRSVMTYACHTWEYVSNTHLKKMQPLQNRILNGVGYLDTHTHTHSGALTPHGFQNSLRSQHN